MQLVVFALGDEEYGLPITQVQEIIRFSAAAHHPQSARLDSRRDQPSRPDHPGVRPEASAERRLPTRSPTSRPRS